MRSKQSPHVVHLPHSKKGLVSTSTSMVISEKTALFVPKKQLIAHTSFIPSKSIPKVFVTRNYQQVLSAVFKYGEVGIRGGIDGLETDPSRQQIIIYTVVRAHGHVLWYQRADKSSVRERGVLGEPRLQGKYSFGFGGHKTRENVQASWRELIFLKDLLPVIRGELASIIGLQKGLFMEIEEELGIQRSQVKKIQLIGSFFDERIFDPSQEIQVNWVHTAVACILDIDETISDSVKLQKREVAKAWWVPYSQMKKTYNKLQKDYYANKGPEVEPWSGILLTEFLDDIVGE